jgi:hypothetical protein
MADLPFFFLSFFEPKAPQPKSSVGASGSGSSIVSFAFGSTLVGSSMPFLVFFFFSFVPNEPQPKSSAAASTSGSGAVISSTFAISSVAFLPFFFLSFLIPNEPQPKSSAGASGSGSGIGVS